MHGLILGIYSVAKVNLRTVESMALRHDNRQITLPPIASLLQTRHFSESLCMLWGIPVIHCALSGSRRDRLTIHDT